MKIIAVLIILLVVFPITYLELLGAIIPHNGLSFHSGWEDNTFETWYSGPVLVDNSFEDWTTAWKLGGNGNSSGFSVWNQTLVLYAIFKGYDANNQRGVTGIMIQRNVSGIDTRVSPFLVIQHRESTSDSALMFSFGITDAEGNWYDGGWYHVSSHWSYLEFDLRKLYNGTITTVSLRLTDDFDPKYAGGIQYAFVKYLAIYKEQPMWKLVYNHPINANISSENGILKVYGSGNLSAGTIVSAQRLSELPSDLGKYRYLKVSVKSSSIDVAARIVIWADPTHSYTVLLKTYNDTAWHTEIIDLSFFGIFGRPYLIELGWVQIEPRFNSDSVVWYQGLSFGRLAS